MNGTTVATDKQKIAALESKVESLESKLKAHDRQFELLRQSMAEESEAMGYVLGVLNDLASQSKGQS
jgi:molecular chaperone GrpE (heat shock protein)